MKLIDTLVITAATALLCVAAQQGVAATPQPDGSTLVAQNDATPPGIDRPAVAQRPGERGARAAAARGPQELRRYLSRTRMIFALQYGDFVRQ